MSKIINEYLKQERIKEQNNANTKMSVEQHHFLILQTEWTKVK